MPVGTVPDAGASCRLICFPCLPDSEATSPSGDSYGDDVVLLPVDDVDDAAGGLQ